MNDYAALAEYRHFVAESYAAVRAAENPAQACVRWRAARDRLFREHAQSPIPQAQRADFLGLSYTPYNPAWRFVLRIDSNVERETFEFEAREGVVRYTRIGQVRFTAPDPEDETGVLSLFWIEGYGGGLFLPIKDTTAGRTTYGGGRYLIDTIKGADLGVWPGKIVLDFNFAYHPSCFYNPQYVCPLSPPENQLAFPVPVGEVMMRDVR